MRVSPLLALSLLVVASACAAGPAEDADGSDEATGVAQSEVQATDGWKQFAIVQDGSRAAKSTGALEVPLRRADGTQATITSNTGLWGLPIQLPARGTCGVTFVSPHYAITAAHCVEQSNVPDPANNTLTVRQYDVTNASLLALNAAALIKGTYPSYEPLSTAMKDVAGYQSTAYTCKLVSRCASFLIPESPALNCDFSGDIAMLHCSNRASDAPWLPVAPSDPLVGPVEMYWFHELLSPIPLDPPAVGAPAVDFDRFAHYSSLNALASDKLAARLANWHYIGSKTNALLPLKSVPWSNGEPRKRLFNSTATDLFGCHGTSGSGVLQRNAAGDLELLGPVSTSGQWGANRLCNHPDDFEPGRTGLSYTPNDVTLKMTSKYSRNLMLDRFPITVPRFPVAVLASP